MPSFDYYNKKNIERIDLEEYSPISVVANFNANGKCIPVYIQVEENQERITFKVEKIHRTIEKFGVIQFDCSIRWHERMREISVYYLVSRSLWMVKK